MKKTLWKRRLSLPIITLLVSGLMTTGLPGIGAAAGTGGLMPLNSVPVPLPPPAILNKFIRDKAAAIQLGKALYWDMRAGGDGIQACASCHFQAGADVRTVNAINPGPNGIFDTAPAGGALVPTMFPVLSDDVVGSPGITEGIFLGLSGKPSGVDISMPVTNGLFGTNRQVTGRNTPSAINAIYNYRNFYDGRASNTFNGMDPSGLANPTTSVYQVINGVPVAVTVAIPNASAASQATGPPNSPVEMCNAGRNFLDLGRKMLPLVPLAKQFVDPTDSVLGPLSRGVGMRGLKTSYTRMIKAAFMPRWWNTPTPVANGYTIMEANFSLYWGLSIMLYESTLVSDQTPLDNFLAAVPGSRFTPSQQLGMNVYVGKGRCNKCHGGAELTEAAVSQAKGDPLLGFTNTGVRPVAEDGGDVLQPGLGLFKNPGLRNVELNGPFFHNGSAATLRQVVEFYNRGGDFPGPLTDPDVLPLNLTELEKVGLVDFMLAMTDDRVRFERAPFDHPSLALANGSSLPAVGAAGIAAPLQPFLNLNQQLP